MRIDGTLAKWNDDRGFGFIAPTQGGQEIFVHISSFPKDGRRPRLNEPLSFEIERDKDGRKRAVSVHRPTPSHARQTATRPPRRPRSVLSGAVTLVLLVAIGAYGYNQYSRRANAIATPTSSKPATGRTAPSQRPRALDPRCDGRIYCSQMTSCAEAKFFLKNCPDTRMDGDNDGVPCEQQWCTSPFAN
jgi:cold shock CspA family protein